MRSASNCSVRGRYYQSKFDTEMITYLFFRNCHGTSPILSHLYGVLSPQFKKLSENQFEEGMSVKFCDLNVTIFSDWNCSARITLISDSVSVQSGLSSQFWLPCFEWNYKIKRNYKSKSVLQVYIYNISTLVIQFVS